MMNELFFLIFFSLFQSAKFVDFVIKAKLRKKWDHLKFNCAAFALLFSATNSLSVSLTSCVLKKKKTAWNRSFYAKIKKRYSNIYPVPLQFGERAGVNNELLVFIDIHLSVVIKGLSLNKRWVLHILYNEGLCLTFTKKRPQKGHCPNK